MNERNPDEYVEWALAFLLRWRELGHELPYFSIINEPGHWRGGRWSAHWLATVTRLLGNRMRAEGLKTMLVVPDDLNACTAYRRARVIMADEAARRFVGALAYHLYGGRASCQQDMKELAEKYGVPVWMTEYTAKPGYSGSMKWAEVIHRLVADYGVSAVDIMGGIGSDRGIDRYNAEAPIQITFDNGRYVSHRLTSKYYVTGQYSRFVRPGHRRIAAQSTDHAILVTAFSGKSDLVAVLINTSVGYRDVAVTQAAAKASIEWRAVRTSASENWLDLGPLQRERDEAHLKLPPSSVTTLIGQLR